MPPSADLIRIGFLASLVAGLATGVGALPVLFTREVSDRMLDVMLGFAAGVMLAATAFSLLLPLGLAFAAGAMLFVVCDELIPESHRKGTSAMPPSAS